MKIWIVWNGDGYGHNSIVLITADEGRARKCEMEEQCYWIEEHVLEDLGNGIEDIIF